MTKTFQKNNRIRSIISNLFVFARSESRDRFELSKEDCRLLEEFLVSHHRRFFGYLPEDMEEKDEED